MIYKVLFFCLFLFASAQASQRLEFSTDKNCKSVSVPQEYKKIPLYTLQILSTKSVETAQKILKTLPRELKKEIKLYKTGEYIASRYSKATKPQALQKYKKLFRNYGFKDAYIIKTTKWHMLHNFVTSADGQKRQKENPSPLHKKRALSEYIKSQTIIKAENAYKRGDESMALLYYEMLLNAGVATEKVKNNLCYLYGKRGAWFEAKKIIESEKYISKLLYAYAYGALETNQDNFMQSLGQYILLDKSGRLALLSAAYYEKRGDFPRALTYYRLAYQKNPSDLYNLFAYARALDISKHYKEALKYYKEALRHTNKNKELYSIIKKRAAQLTEAIL